MVKKYWTRPPEGGHQPEFSPPPYAPREDHCPRCGTRQVINDFLVFVALPIFYLGVAVGIAICVEGR